MKSVGLLNRSARTTPSREKNARKVGEGEIHACAMGWEMALYCVDE